MLLLLCILFWGKQSTEGLRRGQDFLASGILQFKPPEHELQHLLPTVEADIPREGSNVVEERIAAHQGTPHKPIAGIVEIQDSMEQESHDIEGQQEVGQLLLAMAKIMPTA